MPFSGGVFIPFPTPATLVYPPSFPFRKTFWVSEAIWYSALEIEVITSYDTWASAADVRINGTSIGKIAPRPWSLTGGELSSMSIHFSSGLLPMVNIGGRLQRTGNSLLEIVPAAAYDYLIVGPWRVHYYQFWP
jgi:hypothetical protein